MAFLICAAGITAGSIVAYALRPWASNAEPHASPADERPAELLNDPGNPENAIRDFNRIYLALDAYRKHYKTLPKTLRVYDRPLSPGGVQLTEDDLHNPDAILGNAPRLADQCYAAFYSAPRPDGSPKPAFPAPGERDVWVYTPIYIRQKQQTLADGKVEMSYSGEFIVLFSDGKIERVPHGDVLMVPKGANRWGWEFPGQTGIPKDAVRKRDFNKSNSKMTHVFE